MSTGIAGAAWARRFREQIRRRSFPLIDASPRPASHAQEAQQLQQLRAGEAEAWTQLLAEWSPQLYSYLTTTLGDEAAAQQALQALFSQLVQRVMGGAPIANLPLLILTLAYQQGAPVYQPVHLSQEESCCTFFAKHEANGG